MRAARYMVVTAHLALMGVLLAAFTYDAAQADEPGTAGERDLGQTMRDAWIAGRLESAYLLNEHLNPFDINVEVRKGVVKLDGSVASDIQKELAGTIAEGVEGAREVNNNLAVKPRGGEPQEAGGRDGQRGFGQWVSDATTTAIVKSRLAANEHIDSLDIDVDTEEGVVTLNGMVESEEARTLAEVIASNSRNVRRVRNELTVKSTEPARGGVSQTGGAQTGKLL